MPNSVTAPPAVAERKLFSTEIRPGVSFPDWTVVTSDRVRAALNDIFHAFGIENCWRNFTRIEDLCRRAILEAYLREGRPPTMSQLCATTGLLKQDAEQILRRLRQRDLVLFDEQTATILGAYPLTESKTEHRVHLGDVTVHAMCAIDALGVGRMYGRDVIIESTCRATQETIRIATIDRGIRLASVEPLNAVVWTGIRASEGCAASTLCPLIAFFASDVALEHWRLRQHPDSPGHRLSVPEAMEAGMAIFGPMLAEEDATAGQSRT